MKGIMKQIKWQESRFILERLSCLLDLLLYLTFNVLSVNIFDYYARFFVYIAIY